MICTDNNTIENCQALADAFTPFNFLVPTFLFLFVIVLVGFLLVRDYKQI